MKKSAFNKFGGLDSIIKLSSNNRGNHSGRFEGVLSLVLNFILSPENEVKHVLTLITLVSKCVFTLAEFKNQVAPTWAAK